MTELNASEHSDPVQPSPDWPEAAGPAISDPRVAAVLARLAELPGQPVDTHEEAYAGLHDGLLAALNEEPAGAGSADGNA
ncbi:hypothetical protein ACU18_12660 [Arthrobacter sp. ZBG10]|uniref:hypothetical protein n=1 Tax=Arthrobacter sp. ZBG10 TaxID=1676590 RepID=UPI00067FDFA0|nr:hypothetical protein [Arthrobacter sp. ZBG10]KNH16707.1 hypothetical protein ACU18_12660 [Arthrobacter sp. ZBG10]